MGRPQRLDVDGAWHHVMNRGAGRQTVFHTAADGTLFLDLLGQLHKQLAIEVHAFCLMGNHFHLLLRCPSGGLSVFMQHLGSSFTRQVNLRRSGDGPLFRARFRSIPIDTVEYISYAGRYIHRNPVDIRPPVALDHYRWSSMRYYAGHYPPPRWLSTSTLLGEFDHDRRRYVDFVASAGSDRDQLVASALVPLITALLDELNDPDLVIRQGLERTLAVAAIDRCDGAARAALTAELGLVTADSLRQARGRAARLLAAQPRLVGVVERALALAA